VDLRMMRELLRLHLILNIISLIAVEVTSPRLHLWGRECAKELYPISLIVINPLLGVLRLVGGSDAEDPSYIVWV